MVNFDICRQLLILKAKQFSKYVFSEVGSDDVIISQIWEDFSHCVLIVAGG